MRVDHDAPWVLITVHKQARELDSKLWLAATLIRDGFNVVIGRTGALRALAERLPRGIYMDFRFVGTRKPVFEIYRAAGHKVVCFDEEATSFHDKDHYRTNLVSPEALSLTEAAFCWGDFHADVLRSALPEAMHGLVQITGHPRFDMLRHPLRGAYQALADELRATYGRFFLVNSSTGGWILEGQVDARWRSYVDRGIVRDVPTEKEKFYAQYHYRLDKHRYMVALIEAAARALPDHKIIVRPHFTEREASWLASFETVPENVLILHSHSSVPWMLAAEAVIHNSCTTGTEAFLAEVPVISYRPVKHPDHEPYLPNALSLEVEDEAEAVDLLRAVAAGERDRLQVGRAEREAIFDRMMYGRTGPFASVRIAAVLRDIAFTAPDSPERLRRLLKKGARTQPLRAIKRAIDMARGRQRSRGTQETEITCSTMRKKMQSILAHCDAHHPPIVIREVAGEVFVVVRQDSLRAR
ncbi:surface carbohydrate biosynthesis protein [Blastochloris sulfoviridis]|nr:surface carbohydrate biosynthesis protein [Blastochloris sulfoviridis]